VFGRRASASAFAATTAATLERLCGNRRGRERPGHEHFGTGRGLGHAPRHGGRGEPAERLPELDNDGDDRPSRAVHGRGWASGDPPHLGQPAELPDGRLEQRLRPIRQRQRRDLLGRGPGHRRARRLSRRVLRGRNDGEGSRRNLLVDAGVMDRLRLLHRKCRAALGLRGRRRRGCTTTASTSTSTSASTSTAASTSAAASPSPSASAAARLCERVRVADWVRLEPLHRCLTVLELQPGVPRRAAG
jgi:hypothetical protein